MNEWYGVPLWELGLGVLPFVFGTLGPDPLLWRAWSSADPASFGGHHTLILVMYSIVFLAIWKGLSIKPVLAASAIFYVVAWHELLWWAADVGSIGTGFLPAVATGYLFPLCFGAVLIYPQIVKLHWKYVLWMVGFYAVWLAIGFPVTINFVPGGITVYYLVPWVNGLEILSWVWAFVGFWVLCRMELTKSQQILIRQSFVTSDRNAKHRQCRTDCRGLDRLCHTRSSSPDAAILCIHSQLGNDRPSHSHHRNGHPSVIGGRSQLLRRTFEAVKESSRE
jgi:hypothetical protein